MKTGKRKVVLHIGWPKTGTTTLQKHVFPKLAGYRYLGTYPGAWKESHCTTQMVHLLAYASVEKIEELQTMLWNALVEKESAVYGSVDTSVPLLLSEEAILSSLLRVSDHQHHGFCTASLEQILDRLQFVEDRWNVEFDVLLTERDPIEILHAYYAQAFFLFRRVPALDSFSKYLKTGLSQHPMRDLGFAYLKPGYIMYHLRKRLGAARVFSIGMSDLLTPTVVKLGQWYPSFPDVPISKKQVENKRSVSTNVKLSHFRPIWLKKKPFKLFDFLRKVKWMFLEEHGSHDKLEVPIVLRDKERIALTSFFCDTADGEGSEAGIGESSDGTDLRL